MIKKPMSPKKLSGKGADSTVQLIKIPPEVHQGFKLLAAEDSERGLREFYDLAIDWFLKKQAKKSFNYYLASSKRGKYTSLWISTSNLARVKVVAARDAQSNSRVIYTAMVLYLEHKKVL